MINLSEEANVTYLTLTFELEKASIPYETRAKRKSFYLIADILRRWCGNLATELQKFTFANSFNRSAVGITTHTASSNLKICRSPYIRDGLLINAFISVPRDFCASSKNRFMTAEREGQHEF